MGVVNVAPPVVMEPPSTSAAAAAKVPSTSTSLRKVATPVWVNAPWLTRLVTVVFRREVAPVAVRVPPVRLPAKLPAVTVPRRTVLPVVDWPKFASAVLTGSPKRLNVLQLRFVIVASHASMFLTTAFTGVA